MSLAVVLVENRYDVNEIFKRHLKYLPKYSTPYHVNGINSIVEYNKLLMNVEFWGSFEEENILIIQHDSELFRFGIEDFYEYDYVGAPWKFYPYVGNGGLSFRKKSAMIKIIENIQWHEEVNEDIYFAHGCKLLNLNVAPVEVAKLFSCETIFEFGTFGAHAIDKHLSQEQCKQLRKQYEYINN